MQERLVGDYCESFQPKEVGLEEDRPAADKFVCFVEIVITKRDALLVITYDDEGDEEVEAKLLLRSDVLLLFGTKVGATTPTMRLECVLSATNDLTKSFELLLNLRFVLTTPNFQ